MPAFQPTADQFRAFRDDPYEGPIAQVNLLKFRVKSEYGPDDPEAVAAAVLAAASAQTVGLIVAGRRPFSALRQCLLADGGIL